MKNDEMIYITATKGKRPKTIPIVIEIQMLASPGFKKLEEKYGFEGICKNAELSAQCTMMPITDFGFDAAIHMSDLSILLEALGAQINYGLRDPSKVVANPVRTIADVEKITVPEPEEAMKIWLEALRIAKKELAGKVPIIGWVAAPLSTAAFLVEGGFSSGVTPFHKLKTMIYSDTKTLHSLLSKITEMYERFIPCQVDAGADIIMVLDLFAPAAMSPYNYQEFSFPYIKRLVRAIKTKGAPVFFASDGTSYLYSPYADLGIDVIGVDWTIELGDAIKRLGGKQVIQGNLEPHCLFAHDDVIEKRVREIVEAGKAAPAHIFSLGGWIIRGTPFDKVKFLVDLVHSL